MPQYIVTVLAGYALWLVWQGSICRLLLPFVVAVPLQHEEGVLNLSSRFWDHRVPCANCWCRSLNRGILPLPCVVPPCKQSEGHLWDAHPAVLKVSSCPLLARSSDTCPLLSLLPVCLYCRKCMFWWLYPGLVEIFQV
ncbi:unnamed protein product [Discosporangium mesarthrocarpum]